MRRSKTWSVWLLGGFLWGQVGCLVFVLVQMHLERRAAVEEKRLVSRAAEEPASIKPFDGGEFCVELAHEVVRLSLESLYSDYRAVCFLCGAREQRIDMGAATIARNPESRVGGTWWDALVPANHQHEWHTVGCVYGIGKVSCTEVEEEELFLGTLPRFRDQELARNIGRRLVAMSMEDRWREQIESQRLEGIDLLMESGTEEWLRSPPDAQARSYERWRSAHPVWQDLFPPTSSELESRK